MRPTTITPPKTTFMLPDLLANWPFKRTINQAFSTVAPISAEWIEDFKAFDAKTQRSFNKCNFGLIASLAYPRASPEHLRAGCDLMNTFFVFDDISDCQTACEVRKVADIIMDAIRNPDKPRPDGEPLLGEIHRSFWALASAKASITATRRFVKHYELYAAAVCEQAEDRDNSFVRDIDAYMALRRDTIGAKPSFDLLLLAMEIPDEKLDDPKIVELELLAIDMIILGNDVYSYNVEQSRGDDGHNMVSVAMASRKLSVQGAMDYIGEQYATLGSRFLSKMTLFTNSDDSNLASYVWGLGNWVTANVEWSFESERYFGTSGPKIRNMRRVELLPKKC